MLMDLITHGYLFNQIMFINSITLNLFIYWITLCQLNVSLSFIIFNHPDWGIFHLGPILQFKFHWLLIQVLLIN